MHPAAHAGPYTTEVRGSKRSSTQITAERHSSAIKFALTDFAPPTLGSALAALAAYGSLAGAEHDGGGVPDAASRHTFFAGR